ncbi:ribonuclease HII [Salinisphaera sp. T31B1]|uniref:ribonuclease HII n=1 Tax=Salinisphaera sp. T31B1 TaxID=727963 RepID=UPI00333E9C96
MSRRRFACPFVAGVDEVGRGPLAGPVVAAAVILPARPLLRGLGDSKTLSPAARQTMDQRIRDRALAHAIGQASVAEIDTLNILQASLLAMRRAVAALPWPPSVVWVDGNQHPGVAMPARTIIGGDARVPAISAASILAKVARDAQMVELDARFPGYGLAAHKGYGTALHRAALVNLGVSPIHRRSFAPVARLLNAAQRPLDYT